jgi:hypothetical protein
MDGKKCVKTGERCGCCRGRWPLIAIIAITLFAIGFGVRTCFLAGDADKMVEETSYKATSYFYDSYN